jgi:hypothetical protein
VLVYTVGAISVEAAVTLLETALMVDKGPLAFAEYVSTVPASSAIYILATAGFGKEVVFTTVQLLDKSDTRVT